MSIGLQLKRERESKDISLKDASAKTRIQEKFLEALENDDILSLPNPVYTKGFLKKYAEFLGLDPAPLLEDFDRAGLAKVTQVINLRTKEPPTVMPEKYIKKIIIGIIAVFVFVGIMFFIVSSVHKLIIRIKKAPVAFQYKKNKAAPKNIKKEQPRKIVVKQKAVPPAPKTSQPIIALSAQPAQNTGLDLIVTAKRSCRLSIKADNELLFEDFISAGKSQRLQAKQEFELSVSDGSAVDLDLNGKRLGSIGRGSRKNILITKDGIKKKA